MRESPARRTTPSRPRRAARAWITPASYGVSLLLHAAVIALLVALVLPRRPPAAGPNTARAVAVRWVMKPPQQLPERLEEAETSPEAIADAAAAPGTPGADAPSAPRRDVDVESPSAAAAESLRASPRPPERQHPAVGTAFSPPPLPAAGVGQARPLARGHDRRGRGKAAALARYGGGGRSEDAVSRGLRWLAEHQHPGGGWRAGGFSLQCGDFVPCRGAGSPDYDVGVTALAVLAFLGAGHLPSADDGLDSTAATRLARTTAAARAAGSYAGPYGDRVRAALRYLMESQNAAGVYGLEGTNYMYNHAIATFAVAEACALTGSRLYFRSAARAVEFSAYSQQRGGGWDYTSSSTGRDDLSISGWQVMAFASATKAGIEVPRSTRARLRRYLDQVVAADGTAVYANVGMEAGRRGINMVAVGLLSTMLLEESPHRTSARRAAERLLLATHAPDWRKMSPWERHFQSYYYWYTATLALFLHSAERAPERWQAWNHFILRELLRLQSRRSHVDGSWPPEANWIGISGGRVYATAMGVLTLESYYRYEPMQAERSSATGGAASRSSESDHR